MRLIDGDTLIISLGKVLFGDNYADACQAVDAMPTIEPKKGKWIELDCDEDKYDIVKCPCCKHTFTVDSYHWTDIGFVKDDFKFCPNCGADMRGEEHETD